MDALDLPPPRKKRFTFKSYEQSLKSVHLPSSTAPTAFDEDLGDNASHFHERLGQLQELSLAPAFVKFAEPANRLAESMPLLLHNWRQIVQLWTDCVREAAATKDRGEAVKPLLELMKALLHDLRSTLSPMYPAILNELGPLLLRKLEPLALTELLATLVTFFRYILIPLLPNTTLLSATWKQLQRPFVEGDDQGRRMLGEVWGATLRRMKADQRDACIRMMMESLKENPQLRDGIAWVIVEACQAPSRSLHGCAPGVISTLVQIHLVADEEAFPESTTLLRRALTSLLHHSSGPPAFHPISLVLIDSLKSQVVAFEASSLESDLERLSRVMSLIETPCIVRKGARIPQEHLGSILSILGNLKASTFTAVQNRYVSLLISALTGAELSVWMGPGRKTVERIWENPAVGLRVAGGLADSDWDGWNAIVQPGVLKHLPTLLRDSSHVHEIALGFLSTPAVVARLRVANDAWLSDLQDWVKSSLQSWAYTLSHAILLTSILPLVPSLLRSSVSPELVKIIEKLLALQDIAQHHITSFPPSILLAQSLKAVGRSGFEHVEDGTLVSWTNQILSSSDWCQSPDVVSALVELCEARPDTIFGSVTSPKMVTEALEPLVLSYDRSLRLGALRVMSIHRETIDATAGAGTSSQVPRSTIARTILELCLDAENVSLDVAGVRERIVKINRVGSAAASSDSTSDNDAIHLAVRWLLAQLQVNLRPLWAPAQQSLANVMERHPAATWDLVFSELKRSALQISSSKSEETVQEAPLAQLVAVDGVNDVDDAIDGLEVEQEQEKTWRCPNANRRRVLIKHWFEPLEHVARSRIRSLQHSPDRLDVQTYEVELLGSLSRSPAIPEKRSRELVPFFLSLVPSTLPRRRLKAYFGLLSKFVNPKALHSTSTLYDIYQTMLSKPDRELQEAALSCILTYRSPALKRHEEQLRALLDETKWRDELSMLDIGSIETAHRSDVLPVLTGLLYGLIGERKRRHSGPDRRAAVLQALCNLHSDELVTFINLMLAPFPPSASDPITNDIYEFRGVGNATTTQQAGFLNLLGDVLKIMGSKSFAFWPKLMALTVEIIHSAQVGIVTANDVSPGDGDSETRLQEDGEPVESPDADEDVDVDEGSSRPSSRAYRSLRQAALKRIVGFFQISHDAIDYAPYIRLAFPTVITPRLATLPVENTQGPSALLDLFTEWASASSTAIFLVEHDDHLLPRVFECLNGVKVKPSVIMKVFDLVDHLLSLTPDHESLVQRVLAPHIPKLLRELSFMFQRLIKAGLRADPITQRMIDILSSLSEHMKDADDARRLAELILPLFKRPARIVPEKSKTNLLRVVRHLMPLVPDYARSDSGPFNKCFDALTALFQSLKARTARQELAAAFETLMSADPSFEQVSIIVGSLNAYSLRRVDEPDFNKRLAAFAQLNDSLHAALDTRGWKVVIHNMMFFILDPEEVALRSSAAESLRLFIRAVHAEAPSEAAAQQHDLRDLFDRILYTSLRFALRSKSEQVRSDVLGVIAFAIDNLDSHRALQEMRPLLADGDAEANFFNNIYHIQLHRRTRALRRLADFVTSSTIRQSTVADLFVPIIEHFIAGVESLDHHLVNEAITTLGALADKLSWSAYYALHQRHLASAKQKTGTQKIRVRALVAILDHFTFKMSDIVDSAEPHDLDDTEGGDEVPMQPEQLAQRTLQAKIADVVTQRLLPSLLDFMEQRDDTEDIVRLPVAVGVANVAQHLSEASRHSQLGKLIVILSQALRSKSQETRDVVRDTIGKIALMLGPAMLPEILKQMRAALLRGPQLHVLAFVSHSLLVLVTSPEHAERFKNLDSSVADISHIAAEVVFGQSGRDVMSEDFRTKVREVRGSATRGLDTFALIARHVSPSKISALLGPVRAIMHETEASKSIQQIDDVLRRIASGLNANEHLSVADMLVLCHTLISQNAKFLQEDPRQHSKKRKKADVDVQIKRVQSEANDDIYANNSYRFVTLGLDLFITAYRRGRFDYKEASVLSRLEGMVSAIGNTLYSTNSAVVSLGVRAASSIAHCPLKSLSKSLPVYVKRIFSIIRQAGSTDSEMIRHTFKSLAIIIRDCPEAKVQDEDLTFLLEIIVPDIEEKDRQIAVFALLRAIVARKFVVPEIYDVMEKVAEIMVTNQSMQVQELCRGVLLQFLLDYPQGKGRLRTQMSFLAKNLSYVFESGRLSVLELLGAIIAKFDGALLHEYNELLSVALFMVLANDDSTKCRELAAELTKSLYSRSEDAARQEMMTRLHLWASKGSSSTLRRTVAQVYGIIVEGHGDLAAVVLSDLDSLTESSASILREVQSSLEDDNEDAFAEHDESQLDWQLAYHALTAMARVLKAKPDAVRNPKLVHWDAIAAHLIFPHAWVRLATARLIGTLCGGYPPSPPPPDLPDSHPLSRHGIIDLAHKLCAQLRSPHLDDALSLQVVKNLFYVGKCFSVWPESRSATASESQADANADVEEYASDEEEIEEETKGDVGAEGPVGKSNAAENPMRWLFSRLSYQARSAHIARRNRKVSSEIPWVIQPLSVLKWFAAMVNHLPKEDVARFLTHILAPVYRIIEDDTIRDPQMVDLRNTAQELQTLVQDKVGTTLFANEYSRIRQGVLDVRRERRTARVVQITTAPEFAAKRKIQRNANKKASRKRKHQEFTKEKIKLGLKRARYE